MLIPSSSASSQTPTAGSVAWFRLVKPLSRLERVLSRRPRRPKQAEGPVTAPLWNEGSRTTAAMGIGANFHNGSLT